MSYADKMMSENINNDVTKVFNILKSVYIKENAPTENIQQREYSAN